MVTALNQKDAPLAGCYDALPRSIEAGVTSSGGLGVAKTIKRPGEPNGLKRLEARLTAKRAPFSAYLMEHYQALADVIARHGPHWDEIAKWAEEEGHTGGKPISADAARKAYDREGARRKNLAKAAAKPAPKAKPANIPAVQIISHDPEPAKPDRNNDPLARIRKVAAADRPWDQPSKPERKTRTDG